MGALIAEKSTGSAVSGVETVAINSVVAGTHLISSASKRPPINTHLPGLTCTYYRLQVDPRVVLIES